MTVTSMPCLNNLFFLQGKVFAEVLPETYRQPLLLRSGSLEIAFEPCDERSVPTQLIASDRFEFDGSDIGAKTSSEPAETSPGSVFACWVNHLPDWTLSGAQTLQTMITRKDDPAMIRFDKPIKVPPGNQALSFKAAIASHRAKARFVVAIRDLGTGAETVEDVAFEQGKSGGQLLAGYKTVDIPLTTGTHGAEVRFSILYDEYLDDGTGTEPFLFIADPRVSPLIEQPRQPLRPTHAEQPSPARENTQWMWAPVPLSAQPGAQLKIADAKSSTSLRVPEAPQIDLKDDFGHILVFSAASPADGALLVDGRPIERVSIGLGDNVLRLPNMCLDGAHHHVAIKDASGTTIALELVRQLPAVLTPLDIIQRETPPPYPTTIFPQTARRYAALKQHMHAGTEQTDFAQLALALATVEGGYDRVRLEPLAFPEVENPDVSIIIPAHNKVEVTYLALCSLLLAWNEASFEVIVVDDASSDETAELEKIVSGISVIHNAQPQRFIRSCNAGAKTARGRFIVLLNNDIEATSGWLDELIAAFDRFDNVGVAGAKLLYPNGQLQDAGGIIWGSGNPWNYGNAQNPEEPRFCYARQVDYLSGAAMMVPRALWEELDGLSSYLEPMYFEDTDFAFKVREAGYTTWLIPSSVVYHYEGMTSGTDVSTGYKRYQEVNRPKFKRRWARAFDNFGTEGENPDLEKDRGIVGRVLFVDYSTPRPDQDAGSYAAMQEIRLVQSLGYKVSLLPMNMAHLGSYTETLQKMGVEVIYAPFYHTPSEYIEQHATEFDAFFLTRYNVARDVIDLLRRRAPKARILFNNADLHFLREIRAARSEGDTSRLENARTIREQELEVINKADVVLSYNDVEHSVIQAYTDGAANVVKCPWIVDLPAKVAPLRRRKGLSFLGSYRHHPNAEGISWFVREVLPTVEAKTGPMPLAIYGSGMGDEIRALESDTVKAIGFVDDLADAFDRHRVFVAPLLSGAGIKGKVLSALAHGVPCVLTPTAAEGIGLRSGHDCFIAQEPADWAEAIAALTADDDLWKRISDNARSYLSEGFSFEEGRRMMRAAFEAAGLFKSLG